MEQRNKWTTSRGDPQYSGRKKPKRTFPFEFPPKFPESLAKWKALIVSRGAKNWGVKNRKKLRTKDLFYAYEGFACITNGRQTELYYRNDR